MSILAISKKSIIISIGTIIVIAVAAVAILYFLKPHTATSTKNVTLPDLSQNYGACDLLTTTQIKGALGSPASSLATGFDTGKGNVGNGDLAQNCVYGLQKKVTTIDTTMLTNTFYTTVYVYKNQANKDNDIHAYDGATAISGIGDKAGFFTDVDTASGFTDYSIRVDVGLRYFGFAVRQTTSQESFEPASAQAVLTTLAKEVNYSKFQNTK